MRNVEQGGAATRSQEYADRLIRLQTARWKQWLNVQAIFAWNLQRLTPGFTLDLGCGIGRTLLHLDGNGVGIDTNEGCVSTSRTRGLTAFTPDEFAASEYNRPGRFDSLLLAHVAEHMVDDQVVALAGQYTPLVKDDGQLIFLTPQEAGFKSDATHVQFMDFERLEQICRRLGFEPVRRISYPFPRWAGRLFTYNEFVVVGRRKQPRA